MISGNLHLADSALTSAGFVLNYHTGKGGTWSTVTVDANNGSGWYPSISLAADGTPRISYYDTLNDDLMFILKLNQTYLPMLKK